MQENAHGHGAYGQNHEGKSCCTDKSAFVIPDRLAKLSACRYCAKLCPQQRCDTSTWSISLGTILSVSPKKVNETNLADNLYIVSWCTSVHLLVSHGRSHARYPDCFLYRVIKLTVEQRNQVHVLQNFVTVMQSAPTKENMPTPANTSTPSAPFDAD